MLEDKKLSLPDCIFLDLAMPRLDGKAVLQKIKSDDRLKDIPVYIYTTSRETTEARQLMEMGALHFISKPSNEEEVYYLITCALESVMK